MNKIKTVMDNRENARVREVAGQTVYATEEILGSIDPVKDFASFYHLHRVNLDIIEASMLLDYCRGEFTPQEKQAYEKGLSDFLAFFENSADELDRHVLDSKK
jgi:hypothetical protein